MIEKTSILNRSKQSQVGKNIKGIGIFLFPDPQLKPLLAPVDVTQFDAFADQSEVVKNYSLKMNISGILSCNSYTYQCLQILKMNLSWF